MKQFFKNFGTGILFLLMSCVIWCLGTAAYYGITEIPNCTGWEAIGTGFAILVVLFMAGFCVYAMGVIPNSTIDDLKKKLEEKKDD